MGGNESSDKPRDMTVKEYIQEMFRKSPYLENGYPLSKEDSYRYGEHHLVEVSYDRHIVKKRIKVKDDRQFQTYLKNKQLRIGFDQELFVKLLDYDCDAMPEDLQEDGMYKFFIDCYFEHHENDLRLEIQSRKSDDNLFAGSELSSFVQFFIQSGAILEEQNNRHGDIRPEFVCLTAEGKPLLMDNIRDKAGTGSRIAFVSDSPIYCSPILYKAYTRNVMKLKHEKNKDDVFSAGLVILEAGLLEDVQCIFDQDEGAVSKEKLEELIQKFEERYSNSPDLCLSLRRFLVVDELDRGSFKELKNTLAQNAPSKPQTQRSYEPQNSYKAQPQSTYTYNDYQGAAGSNATGYNYQADRQGYGNQRHANQQPAPVNNYQRADNYGNSGYGQGNGGYGQANGGYGQGNSGYGNSGYGQGNGGGYGNSGYNSGQQYSSQQPQGGNPLVSKLGWKR